MNKVFDDFIRTETQLIDNRLTELFENDMNINADMKVMMQYSINAGGKRVRPLLFLAFLRALDYPINQDVLTVAAALEAVHTYSLIHDDLPAMDNDDLRRGQPTSHKKFGEAEAILTGDALLTIAFQWMTATHLDARITCQLVSELAQAAGPAGMIAGQLLDIQGNHQKYSMPELQHLHRLKTGELLIFPAKAASTIAQSDLKTSDLMMKFVSNFGLAFQIHDDIIDVTESTEELGKTAGKDQNTNKNTYVNLLGLTGARRQLKEVLEECDQNLVQLGDYNPKINVEFLTGFLTYLK